GTMSAIGTKRTSRGFVALVPRNRSACFWVTLAIKRYREANKMAEPRADIFYGAETIIAGMIVLLAMANVVYNIGEGEPKIPIVAVVFASLVWLAGWLCHSIFWCPDEVIE
ncbi:MAG: hypothetical protein WBG10_06135, partial [Pseudolabrys sp.]